MKAYKGSRGMAPFILNVGDRWKLVVIFMLQPLYSWETTPVLVQ
jgi:hypothetical protein